MSATTNETPTTRSALPLPKRRNADALARFFIDSSIEFDRAAILHLKDTGRRIQRNNGEREGRLPPADSAAVADRNAKAQRLAERSEVFQRLLDREQARVLSEPRTYEPDSPHSWYLDVARAAVPGMQGHAQAVERLERYGHELDVEVRAGSAEGRRAVKVVAQRSRDNDISRYDTETRAVTSVATSGGAFVTPIYLLDASQFGLVHTYPPSVIAQTTAVPDPGHGLTLELPVFGSGVAVGNQTATSGEAGGVADSAPTAAFTAAQLVSHSGEVEVSQQLFDRSVNQPGIGIDTVIHTALAEDLRTQQDVYCIQQMIAVGGTFAGQAAFTAAKFFGDLAGAKAQMRTAAGTLLRPSALFAAPAVTEWLMGQVDPQGRPVLLPTAPGASVAIVDPAPGYTGFSVLGLPVFEDGNIPASGSNAQIIVAAMPEVLTLVTEPIVRAYVETFAQDLTVVLSQYSMTGIVARHASAIVTLSGAAYLQSPTFA